MTNNVLLLAEEGKTRGLYGRTAADTKGQVLVKSVHVTLDGMS